MASCLRKICDIAMGDGMKYVWQVIFLCYRKRICNVVLYNIDSSIVKAFRCFKEYYSRYHFDIWKLLNIYNE